MRLFAQRGYRRLDRLAALFGFLCRFKGRVAANEDGQFHTQVFERDLRYEAQVAKGLTQMFVAGVSPQKVGEVAQTLMGVAPSASSVSRFNQTLTHQFETWRERSLQAHWRIVYLDDIHFTVRHGEQADSTIVLTADGG